MMGIEHFIPPWDVFFLPLFNLLILFYDVLFSDFALAIIVFTIVIRTVLAPLFVRQIRSSKEMQRMQPLMRELQRKHKGNRQKLLEEQQALYREHGVNPLGGCLPLVVQLPILFALYQALIRASGVVQGFVPDDGNRAAFEALQAEGIIQRMDQANHYQVLADGACNLPQYAQLPQFLPLNCQLIDPLQLPAGSTIDTTISWLFNLNLAAVDNVFAVGLFGAFSLSLLAVLAAVLQFVQVKMTSAPPNPDDPAAGITTTMIYTFPLLTIVWGGVFPSGLILYWIVYTAYLIGQQALIMGWGNLFPLFGWQPGFAPRPQTGIVQAPRTREPRADDEPKTEQPANANPRQVPSGNRGSRPGGRPANRRPGAKRRGRRR